MKEIDVKFLTVIILIINKCYAKYSNVCDTCICQTKPNENILHVNCTETPKFEKLVDLKSFDKSDVHLSLEYMNLTSIQRYTKFEGLNVKTISLDNNYIKTIPPYIFSKYSNLTTLSLANNDIDEVSEDSFGGLTELKTLNISYNALKTFDTIYINDLKKLEVLDLRGNSLFNLPSTSILQKINLNYLDMSENKLTNFPEKAFKLFTELKYLDLSHNQIKELPKNAFEMQNILEKLFISKNRLADIHSEAFPDVNLIKVFNINHNLVSNTEFIKKLTSLTELDLSFNSISSLNTMAWSHSLVTLLVGNNGLMSLDDILKGLPQLKKLDASWNQCSKLPSIINSNLKELILDANGISSLPPRPPGSGALTYLSLSEIPHLTKLQKGCFNGVFSSNVTAEPCARLEIIRANLKSIEKGALTNSNICEINLSWNELTSLPQDTFDWERIKTLDLQGNPWDCSCSMQWLLDKVVAKMYDHHQELLQNLRCSTPKALQATRLVHWFNKTEPMLCSKDNLKEANFITISSSPAMIVLVVVFGIIVVALVATGFYLQRQIIKQRRRSKNRRF